MVYFSLNLIEKSEFLEVLTVFPLFSCFIKKVRMKLVTLLLIMRNQLKLKRKRRTQKSSLQLRREEDKARARQTLKKCPKKPKKK